MNTSKFFTDLIVWQKSHTFVLSVYIYTNDFPKSELYGLTQQFWRVAVSTPANIAEGYRRRTKPEKILKLNEIARLLNSYFNGKIKKGERS